MVEQELMDIIQIFSWVATALGVCIAATYYVITLRNTEKIRKRDQVYQKLQLNMIQWYDIFLEVFYNYTDFNSVEEFRKKYGYNNNPEAFTKIYYVLNHYNSLGILLKDGLVDADLIFQLYIPWSFMTLYEKFEYAAIRVQGMFPDGVIYDPKSYYGIKFLYAEAKKRFPKLNNPAFMNTGNLVDRGRMFDELFKKNPQINA